MEGHQTGVMGGQRGEGDTKQWRYSQARLQFVLSLTSNEFCEPNVHFISSSVFYCAVSGEFSCMPSNGPPFEIKWNK